MSPLGFGVLFVISFALGISWLAWEFDARIGRRRLSRQLPLPLDDLKSHFGNKSSPRLRPAIAVLGFMLVLFACMGASILGRVATMQPETAAAVFYAYPLLQSLWGLLLGFGPILCVGLAVPGTYAIKVGLESNGY